MIFTHSMNSGPHFFEGKPACLYISVSITHMPNLTGVTEIIYCPRVLLNVSFGNLIRSVLVESLNRDKIRIPGYKERVYLAERDS